jgi:hypothetical protein
MSEAIDKKFLGGLKFTGSDKKGELVTRALQPGDVIGWRDNGATVTIATADGQKYTVDKNAKPPKEEKAE